MTESERLWLCGIQGNLEAALDHLLKMHAGEHGRISVVFAGVFRSLREIQAETNIPSKALRRAEKTKGLTSGDGTTNI